MQRRRSNCSTRATARTLAAAAAVWLLAGVAVAQWRPVRTVPKPIDFATSQNDNLFSLTRSQDDIHALETTPGAPRVDLNNVSTRHICGSPLGGA